MSKKVITGLFILLALWGALYCLKGSNDLLGIHSEYFYPSVNRPLALLSRELSPQMQTLWSTGGHTAVPVPVGAVGPEKYRDRLKGVIQNTEIAEVMKAAVNDNISVVLVIGDGMGPMHMALPIYRNAVRNRGEKTWMEKILNEGACGYCLTNMADEIVTGSASAGTALACGKKTFSGMISMDTAGAPLESVLDIAEQKGFATGLVTDTRLTHATPAAFYGNVISRKMEAALARDLVENHEIEVLMGGGAEYFIPQNTWVTDHKQFKPLNKSLGSESGRKDNRNLILQALDNGYTFACNRDQLEIIDSTSTKLLGLFAGSGMSACIDRDDENTGEPSIPMMTQKALDILKNDPEGLFLMIECGRIDWESHQNDVGAVCRDMEEMDVVMGVCYKYYQSNPEKTLLIFTADHEAGGLGLSYATKDLPPERKLASGALWKPGINGLSNDDFMKYGEQKRSFDSMIKEAGSAGELVKLIAENTAFTITKEQAKRVMREKGKK